MRPAHEIVADQADGECASGRHQTVQSARARFIKGTAPRIQGESPCAHPMKCPSCAMPTRRAGAALPAMQILAPHAGHEIRHGPGAFAFPDRSQRQAGAARTWRQLRASCGCFRKNFRRLFSPFSSLNSTPACAVGEYAFWMANRAQLRLRRQGAARKFQSAARDRSRAGSAPRSPSATVWNRTCRKGFAGGARRVRRARLREAVWRLRSCAALHRIFHATLRDLSAHRRRTHNRRRPICA